MEEYKQSKYISKTSLKMLQNLSQVKESKDRYKIIEDISSLKQEDISRVLLEVYQYTMWREEKFLLIKCMGLSQNFRVLEFLIDIIKFSDDIPLACRAILSLGDTNSAIAGSFLTSILNDSESPLRKEAIIALVKLNLYPFKHYLKDIIITESSSITIKMYAILALSHQSTKKDLEFLKNNLLNYSKTQPVLFNATILALGHSHSLEVYKELEQLNTQFRFFANELKSYAMDRITANIKLSLNSHLSKFKLTTSLSSQSQALRTLKELPRDGLRKEIIQKKHQLNSDKECLLRIITHNKKEKENDKNFLVHHFDNIQINNVAFLISQYTQNEQKEVLSHLIKNKTKKEIIKLLNSLSTEENISILESFINSKNTSQLEKIEAINAFVSNAYSQLLDQKKVDKITQIFFRYLKKTNDQELKNRIIRALGQLRYSHQDFLEYLKKALHHTEDERLSAYFALRKIHIQKTADILASLLEMESNNKNRESDILGIITMLSEMDYTCNLDFIAKYDHNIQKKLERPLLKILSKQKINGLTSIITKNIESSSIEKKLLSLAAFKHNPIEDLKQKVFSLISNKDQAISIRAIDSLCFIPDSKIHEQLFSNFINEDGDKDLILKILKSLTPYRTGNYAILIEKINSLILKKDGIFSQYDVKNSLINLNDNLEALSQKNKKRITTKNEHTHSLDAIIKQHLVNFDKYSNNIKIVLRNAELTWHRKDLFDKNVDKSTVIIEYTKSIDLLLQQHLGIRIFARHSQVLKKMQSRLIILDIDDYGLTQMSLIDRLQCAPQFSADNFPAHKLRLVSNSILTGKIMRDQYRTVDGLRAWSIIFLLFLRNFHYGRHKFNSLFPVADDSNQRIKNLAYILNFLQETRNLAAHHGTLINHEKIEEIRDLTFKVYKELDAILIDYLC